MSAVLKAENLPEVRLGDLTEKQAKFVRHLVGGIKQGKAAELAGYAYPEQSGVYLVRQPHIQAAIAQESSRVLMTEGLANSLKFMVTAPGNEKLPGAVRFQAAKWVMENAGHGLAAQRAALGLPDTDKPLSEMSTAELDGLITAMRDRIVQTRAVVIEGEARNIAPDGEGVAMQAIEHKVD